MIHTSLLYHSLFFFFFFNDTATTEIYTLSLHDALPISAAVAARLDHPHRGVGRRVGRERPARRGPPADPAGLVGPGRRADAAGDRELVRVLPLRPLDAPRLRPHRLVRRADPSSVAHHGNARLEPARGVAAALRARAHVARLRGSALIATLVVHVAPRARTTAVAGRHGDAIRIRVAAPPVDGAANAELGRFLAERLRGSRSAVAIAAGAAGRRETVESAGLATDAAVRVLLEGHE